jgi:hypothetical protein
LKTLASNNHETGFKKDYFSYICVLMREIKQAIKNIRAIHHKSGTFPKNRQVETGKEPPQNENPGRLVPKGLITY